jgi:hypothetical protein
MKVIILTDIQENGGRLLSGIIPAFSWKVRPTLGKISGYPVPGPRIESRFF